MSDRDFVSVPALGMERAVTNSLADPSTARWMDFVLESVRSFAAGQSAEDSVTQVFRLLEQRFGIRRAALFAAGDAGRHLVVLQTHGLSAEQWTPRATRGVSGGVAANGRARWVARLDAEPAALAELAEPFAWTTPPWSLASVPVTFRRRVVGVLSVYLRAQAAIDPEGLLDTLEVVAALLAPLVADWQPTGTEQEPERAGLEKTAGLADMVGHSAPMIAVYDQVRQVAATQATVLIRGQSGCGKELVAQAIHAGSLRASCPFVRVNCAALPDQLFESEVFGYERGAFTGALARKKGRFELAQGGTLFLDEVGELSLSAQAKLLRVLQFREFERLGGQETIGVDVRLIAATNRDLEESVRLGTFREDLYYRLNVFSIQLPALRERKQDIPALAAHFVARYGVTHRRPGLELAPAAVEALLDYSFPGNVRELENVIERAVVVCDGPQILARHLPEAVRSARGQAPRTDGSLASAVASLEQRLIREALERCGGSVTRAAAALGTTERVLRYKASRYAIPMNRTR